VTHKDLFIGFLLIGVAIAASGCLDNGGETKDGNETKITENSSLEKVVDSWSSSKWCRENGNGKALLKGCVTQSEAFELTTSVNGSFYHSDENPKIECPSGMVYVCSK
jgi:hypothetical protein